MPQLTAYHRPATVDEALRLLARPGVNTVILGGGTHLVPRLPEAVNEAVDLQAVPGLNTITHQGRHITLGAMVRLQTIVDDPQVPPLVREAARREGPNTMRHAATVGGVIAGPDKESEFLAALLVFEAQIHIQTGSGTKVTPVENFLRDVTAGLGGGLITAVTLAVTGQTAADRVARTPADKPIVAALARRTPEGKLFLALCGVDTAPVLVDPANVKAGIKPPDDFRGSREYRRQMAAVLAKRVINAVNSNQ